MVVYYSINSVVVYLLYALPRRKMTFLNTSLTAWRLCRFGSRQHLFYYECLACKKPLHRNGSWGFTWNFDDWTCQSINLICFAWWFSILSFIIDSPSLSSLSTESPCLKSMKVHRSAVG